MSDGPTEWLNAGLIGFFILVAGCYCLFKISSCAMEKSDEQETRAVQISKEKQITQEEAEDRVIEEDGDTDWGWIACGCGLFIVAFLVFCIVPGFIGVWAIFFMIGIAIAILLNICGCPVSTFQYKY